MVTRPDEYISAEHQAELEDRAAELVDRDWLLNQEQRDRAEARAQLHAEDCAELERRANEYEATKPRGSDTWRWWL